MTMVHLGMNNDSVSGLCCMVQLSSALIAKASADAFGKHPSEIEKWHTKLGKFKVRQLVFLFVANFYILVMKIKKSADIYKGFFGKKGSKLPYYVEKIWKSFWILVTTKKESVQQIQSHLLGGKRNGPSLAHYEEKNLVHLVQNPVVTPDYSKSPEVDIIIQ